MITADDLLAARVVHSQKPDLRHTLAQTLSRLTKAEKPEAGFRTLLGELVRAEVLTHEQAEFAQGIIDRHKRGRALGIYAQLLCDRGRVTLDTAQAVIRSLGDAADCTLLGEKLVGEGHITHELAARLRFQAKLAFDRDQATQLESYQKRVSAERAQTLVGAQIDQANPADTESLGVALDGEETFPSGVYRNELVLPTSAEATGIIDRASLSLSAEQLAPRFPVPDWITTNDPMVGRLIGGYRILGRVGAGAMATVYLCDHMEREVPIALKLLPPNASEERKARFKREILANGFFSHENVIDIYDAGVDPGGHHYLAMEFFDGTDLDAVLETQGSISLRQGLLIARQILAALHGAHNAGIVHRDLKPSNILVDSAGNLAKLMDFGIALIKDLGDFKDKVFESDAGGVTGTPEYLSPEQAFRDPVGPQADLYSLGMVLYRMLAGRLPFESETVSGWISCHIAEEPLPIDQAAPGAEFPQELIDLFARLFEKDPKQRIQTAAEALEVIDTVFLALGSGRKSRFFGRIRRGF